MRTQEVVKVAKLAVETKIYPLFEVIDGKYFLGKTPKKTKKVKEYLKIQGRFKHLSENDINLIQDEVDKDYSELMRLASG
jgi:pyruvate ferredoxin oxidoreductase beta subunit